MSTNLKNPTDQDDYKKRMLSNQSQLMRITPTALLGRWEQQPIKDMISLGTEFETHAYWQGYTEEHPNLSMRSCISLEIETLIRAIIR